MTYYRYGQLPWIERSSRPYVDHFMNAGIWTVLNAVYNPKLVAATGKLVQSTISGFYKSQKSSSNPPRKRQKIMPPFPAGDTEMTARVGGDSFEGGVNLQQPANVLKWRPGPHRSNDASRALISLGRKIDNAQVKTHTCIRGDSSNDCVVGTGYIQAWTPVVFLDKTFMTGLVPDAHAVEAANKETLYSAGAGYKPDTFLVKSLRYEMSLYMTTTPMGGTPAQVVDVYYLKCHRDDVESGFTLFTTTVPTQTASGTYGANVDPEGAAMTIGQWPGITPYDIADITKYWTIGRHEQYLMVQGSCVTLQGSMRCNKVYRANDWENLHSCKAGWTEAILITNRSIDPTNVGDATPTEGKINIRTTSSVKWKPFMNDYRIGEVYNVC